MEMYEVMVAEVGKVGEKNHEYRSDTVYWLQRLFVDGDESRPKKFTHAMIFGGVHVPDVDGNWFIATWVGVKPINVHGYRAGPYSNGALLEFEGRVWDIELGPMVQKHVCTRGA